MLCLDVGLQVIDSEIRRRAAMGLTRGRCIAPKLLRVIREGPDTWGNILEGRVVLIPWGQNL